MPRLIAAEKPRARRSGARSLTRFLGPRGSALLYVIASIALLGALGGGVAYFSSSSSMSQLSRIGANQAYYAALAGQEYVAWLNKNYCDMYTGIQKDVLFDNYILFLENNDSTFTIKGHNTFQFKVNKDPSECKYCYKVSVKGGSGNSESSSRYFYISEAWDSANTSKVGSLSNYFCSKDNGSDGDVTIPEKNSSGGNNVTVAGEHSEHGNDVAEELVGVVTEGDPEYEGEAYIRLGNRTTQGYACLWYNDSLELFDIENYCQNGICTFGSGFRVYFEFQIVSAGADGFTFAIVNGSNNTINDCGGDTSMGELLGYAGPGVSTHGLRPAKLAVEFDTFENDSGYCKNAGSRNDDDGGHLAYVYWGTIDDNIFGTGCKTYDDNLHGAGGDKNSGWYGIDGNFLWTPNGPLKNTRNLENFKIKTGNNITYKLVSNLEDLAVHTFRLEVTRSTNANGSGSYTLKSWLDCTVDGKPCDGIGSVSKDFDESIKSPDLVTNVTMDEYFHNLFDTFIFGFTEATGASAQELRIKDVRLSFKQ